MRGDVRWMAGRPAEAGQDYEAAVASAESVRGRLLLEAEALGYFDQPRLEAYDRLVYLSLDGQGDAVQALSWQERVKAREFLRHLGLRESLRPRGIPTDLSQEEMRLRRELCRVVEAVTAADGADRLAALRDCRGIERDLRAVWSQIEPFDPQYVALRRGEPATWLELKECLCWT
jgi:hypothetical protein